MTLPIVGPRPLLPARRRVVRRRGAELYRRGNRTQQRAGSGLATSACSMVRPARPFPALLRGRNAAVGNTGSGDAAVARRRSARHTRAARVAPESVSPGPARSFGAALRRRKRGGSDVEMQPWFGAIAGRVPRPSRPKTISYGKARPFAPNRTNPAGKRTGARISRRGSRIKRRGRDWTRD
jgi:hypothetical protein